MRETKSPVLTICPLIGSDGGLAEHIVVDAENARRLPSNVSLELAGV